eukprot:9647001-Prorocentrum_lima.AAC.1
MENNESVYYAFVGKVTSEYENIFTVLSRSTLPSEIESPSGDKYIVTDAMLEQSALMHLSEA